MNAIPSRNLLSRRSLLAAGLALSSAPVLTAKAGTPGVSDDRRYTGSSTIAGPTDKVKILKDRVHYTQASSDPDKTCGSCKLFRQPASCLFVEGDIAPHCTCILWTASKAV